MEPIKSTSGRFPNKEGGRHSCLIPFLIITVIVVIVGGGLTAVAVMMLKGDDFSLGGGDALAVVEVTGPIYSSKETITELIKYRKSDRVKGIILRIDSPGGAVTPTQEIYKEIEKTKKVKKVIVSMGSVAASGGLYLAAPADYIMASPSTITGSIGVIMRLMNIEELYGKIGLSANVIKSGKFKDVGSSTRPMKEEERELLQDIVDEMYQQFLGDLAKGRGLEKEKLRPIADGRIFTGEKALAYGLVDEIGNLQDAIDKAKNLTGLEEDAEVIYPEKDDSWLLDLIGGKGSLQLLPQLPRNPITFQYLYLPGQ